MSPNGHGYIFIGRNNQEVHCEKGIYWSFNLVPITRKDDSGTGAMKHLNKKEMTMNVQEVGIDVELILSSEEAGICKDILNRSKLCCTCDSEVETLFNLMFVIGTRYVSLNNVEKVFWYEAFESKLFKTRYKRFMKMRVFRWLEKDLLISVATVLEGSGASSIRIYDEGTKEVSGGIVNNLICCFDFKYRVGMNFETVMLIRSNYLNNLSMFYNLPTFGLPNVFTFIKSPGDQIKSIIHNIEHPVVLDGQRSPSSLEDG
jgi:hypothetical protein